MAKTHVTRTIRLFVLTLLASGAAVLGLATAASAAPVVTTTIPVGSYPREGAVTPDGSTLYVSNSDSPSNSVSVINTATNTVTATITGFNKPWGIAISPDGSRAYVTNSGGNTVSVVNTATNTVTSSITVGSAPVGIAITPDGSHAYVSNNDSSTVSVINLATSAVTSISGFNIPGGVAMTADGARVYVTNRFGNTVSVVSTSSNTIVATVPVQSVPADVALSPNGKAYVTNNASASVSVVDTATNVVVATLPGFDGAYGIAASPDGKHVYVAGTAGLSVIDTATNNATVVSGLPQVWSFALQPDGSRAYTMNVLANTVSVVALQPSPPTGVSATPGVNKLNVSWTAPSYTGGQPISSYTATAQPGGKTCTTNGATTCEIADLTAGTPYTVTVTATNSIGTSMASVGSDEATPIAPSHIILKKETNPATDTTTEFTFDPSWSSDDITLKNKGIKDTVLDPGTYSVVEKPLTGWDLTSATCDDGSPVSAIDLAAGETVTCTFTNTQRGTITIRKRTDPVNSPVSFTMTPTGWNDDKTFDLKGGDSFSQSVPAGSGYSVYETMPDGWRYAGMSCGFTGGSSAQFDGNPTRPGLKQINLAPNGKVDCTIDNRQMATITVEKVTNPSGAETEFTFTPVNWNKNTPFQLQDGGSFTSEYLDAGYFYKVSEAAADGWVQTSRSCPEVIQPKPGEHITCTFTNTRQTAQLRLKKSVDGGSAQPADWSLSATAGAPFGGKNVEDVPGDNDDYATVYAGVDYDLTESAGPDNYTFSGWNCVTDSKEVGGTFVREGDTVTLEPGEVDGADPVKSGTVKLGNGQSETISGLPTGTTCTVTEPTLPAAPTGWTFNAPTFTPANGQVTVTAKDQTVSVLVVNSISAVSPVVVKKVCPIEPVMVKKVKKNGNRILVKKIKTDANCVLLKPVVLCKPVAVSAAGETAFCDTKVTKKGRVQVNTRGYDKVRVTVVVRTKPKPGNEDKWKPNTWRKSWILR
ncbi:MAG: beta-propeller fold lactonase family protein [Candidatus Nanopelagicales bacterium]